VHGICTKNQQKTPRKKLFGDKKSRIMQKGSAIIKEFSKSIKENDFVKSLIFTKERNTKNLHFKIAYETCIHAFNDSFKKHTFFCFKI
jgi:hypothetical protein